MKHRGVVAFDATINEFAFDGASLQIFEKVVPRQVLFSVYPALEIKEQVSGRALPSAGNPHS